MILFIQFTGICILLLAVGSEFGVCARARVYLCVCVCVNLRENWDCDPLCYDTMQSAFREEYCPHVHRYWTLYSSMRCDITGLILWRKYIVMNFYECTSGCGTGQYQILTFLTKHVVWSGNTSDFYSGDAWFEPHHDIDCGAWFLCVCVWFS